MPSVHDQALSSREMLVICDMSNPHDVQHMVEQEKESISTTKPTEVRENQLDILANAITGAVTPCNLFCNLPRNESIFKIRVA